VTDQAAIDYLFIFVFGDTPKLLFLTLYCSSSSSSSFRLLKKFE